MIWHLLWHGDLRRLDPYLLWRRQNPKPNIEDDLDAYARWHDDERRVYEAARAESAALRRYKYSFNSFVTLLVVSLISASVVAALIGFATIWWAGVLSFPLAVAGLVYLWYGWWRGHEDVTRKASDPDVAVAVMHGFMFKADSLAGLIIIGLIVGAVVGVLTTWWAGVLSFPIAVAGVEWGLRWLQKGPDGERN